MLGVEKMSKKIGIICGLGKLARYTAKNAYEKGHKVYIVAVQDNYDKQILKYSHSHCEVKIGQLSKAIKFFKQNEVKDVIMVGLIKHINIFKNLMPDLRAAKLLALLKDKRAKSILKSVISEFNKDGIKFMNSAYFLKDFLAKKGVLTKKKPSNNEQKDIIFGKKIAKIIANTDIGLTAIVSNQSVIAVEGMEGTDQCILRAGEIFGTTKEKVTTITAVKVARDKQDMRFDLPIIGKNTIKMMKTAGVRVLAIESGKTLILDKEEVIETANKNNISIIAI